MNLNKHSKVRTVGLSSSFALLALLGLAVFCPTDYDGKASAADVTQNATFELDFILQKSTSASFAIDFLLAQQLSISMDNLTNTSATVQPLPGGEFKSDAVDFSVSTNSNEGLGVFVYGDGDNTLKGATTSKTIPTVSADTTVGNMPANTWGYNLSTDKTKTPESLTYSAVPATKGNAVDHTDTATTNRAYRLTFGAKVDYNTAPDTYSRTVNVQVIPNSNQTTAINEASKQADTPEGEEYLNSILSMDSNPTE